MEYLRVGVRVRPLIHKEKQLKQVVSQENGITIHVANNESVYSSTYDRIFLNESSQADVFNFVSSSVNNAIKGVNCSILVYGCPGTGRRFTLFGDCSEVEESKSYSSGSKDSSGLISRTISVIFDRNFENLITIYASFCQIINGNVYDGLKNDQKPLNIRENKIYGVHVEGLSEYIVLDKENCLKLLKKAINTSRASTTAHAQSIFQLSFSAQKANKKGEFRESKILFCCLTASLNDFSSPTESRETDNSIKALDQVIAALSRKKAIDVPYRNSKLTRLLKDSLDLSTKTILISTVSPSVVSIAETINTLQFTDKARLLAISPKKTCLKPTKELILRLQHEFQHMKDLVNLYKKGGIKELHHQVSIVKAEAAGSIAEISADKAILLVERLKEENKKIRIELQELGQVKLVGEPYVKEQLQPVRSLLKRNLSNSPIINTEQSPSMKCAICSEYTPCIHYSSPLAHNFSYAATKKLTYSCGSENINKSVVGKMDSKGQMIVSKQIFGKNGRRISMASKGIQSFQSIEGAKIQQSREKIQKILKNGKIKKMLNAGIYLK